MMRSTRDQAAPVTTSHLQRRWSVGRLGASAAGGLVAGLTVALGDPLALLWSAVLCGALVVVVRVVARGPFRSRLQQIVVLAVGVHMVVALGLYAAAGASHGGFITGDDAAYFRLSSALASQIRGATPDPAYAPPLWGGDAYLMGPFVYVETLLFVLFGADVLLPILMNAAIAVATAVMVFAMCGRLFGSRAGLVAAAVVAFYPSLILWSALNLKDALTTALGVAAIWSLIEFALRPRLLNLAFALAAAEILVGLRGYAASTIAITAVISVAVSTGPLRRRLVLSLVAAGCAVVIVLQSLISVGSSAGGELLAAFERERAAMAVGARTGFVPTPTPIATVAVATSPTSPTSTAAATSSSTPARSPSGAAASVIALRPPDDTTLIAGRTFAYLPTGLAYALFAPFPLAARRAQELVAAPEMLFWYLVLAASLLTLWLKRRRWVLLTPVCLTIGGLLVILALAEGNVGTLFRHRAIVVPFVVVLAAPSLIAVWTFARSRGSGSTRAEA